MRPLVAVLGLVLLAGCSTVSPPRAATVAADVDATVLPLSAARWITVISFPMIFGYPAIFRGELRTAEQCRQTFRAAVQMMANHQGNGTVSPCALGVATVDAPE